MKDLSDYVLKTNHRNVLDEVDTERKRQDAQWGGSQHDDKHEPYDWRFFIKKQIDRMRDGNKGSSSINNLQNYRQCLVKIAALAVAAIESYDRKQGICEQTNSTLDGHL